MEFDEAKKCIRELLLKPENDSKILDKASVLVGSLSTIIQIASYAEKLVKEDANFGSLTLGFYASTTDKSGKRKFSTLFGPPVDSSDTTESCGIVERSNERDALSNVEGGVKQVYPIQRTAGVINSNNPSDCLEETTHGIAQGVEAGGVDCYVIPDGIVAKCMSYLYDGSGYTTHPSFFREKNLESINAKCAVQAVKELFKNHKEILRQGGLNTHGLQYGSMIPQHLRNQEILMPNLTLARSDKGQCFKKNGVLKLKLPINKADRNKKAENLALMACFFHHSGHGVATEDVLGAFSKRGYGPDGCNAFQKCSAPRQGVPCRDRPKKTCSFYVSQDNERVLVAAGSVDPFATYLSGQEIAMCDILVRVSDIYVPELMGAGDGTIGREEAMHQPRIWPKNGIERITILGEHGNGDVIGDGIIVARHLVQSEETKSEPMSICNAILLCDCTVRSEKQKEAYPFSEWYSNRLLKPLRDFLGFVPDEIGDVFKGRGGLMLWHEARVCNSFDISLK